MNRREFLGKFFIATLTLSIAVLHLSGEERSVDQAERASYLAFEADGATGIDVHLIECGNFNKVRK